jgi:predicted metal-dependent hydrolase
MGHYNAHTDTLMLSITLDAVPVPRYVIDYVMYHEMLHKQFGVSVVNGRRYAHTPEFRAAEQAFARYEEAEAYLAQMRRKFTS